MWGRSTKELVRINCEIPIKTAVKTMIPVEQMWLPERARVSPPKDKVGNTEKVLEIFVSKSWSDPGTVIDPVTGDGDKLSNVTR